MSSAPDFEGNANRSIISGEFETGEQSAPGFETRGNDSMLGNNDRGFVQDPNYYVNDQLPSYNNIRSGENSLVGGSSTRGLGTTDEYKSSPGFDGVGHQNTSERGLGSHATSYQPPPGHSANLHQNTSTTATANDNATATTPVNPLDYVGISLVGRKFKAVNPDAYYVDKNENY
ncbi:hypothetical protein Tco_0718938 [Tanacetum coccineum]